LGTKALISTLAFDALLIFALSVLLPTPPLLTGEPDEFAVTLSEPPARLRSFSEKRSKQVQRKF
jgi:hypothetical protein